MKFSLEREAREKKFPQFTSGPEKSNFCSKKKAVKKKKGLRRKFRQSNLKHGEQARTSFLLTSNSSQG